MYQMVWKSSWCNCLITWYDGKWNQLRDLLNWDDDLIIILKPNLQFTFPISSLTSPLHPISIHTSLISTHFFSSLTPISHLLHFHPFGFKLKHPWKPKDSIIKSIYCIHQTSSIQSSSLNHVTYFISSHPSLKSSYHYLPTFIYLSLFIFSHSTWLFESRN